MYHFDGESWQPVSLPFGALDLADIHGFAANDIWAVGENDFINPNPPPNFLDSSLVIHYDGVKWQKMELPPGRFLQAVGGTSSSNLFAGGFNGTLFHYDGTHWQADSLPFEFSPDTTNFVHAISGHNNIGEVYMLYSRFPGLQHLLKHEPDGWKEVKYLSNLYSLNDMWLSPWGKLYGVGGKVLWWDGSDWNLLNENEDRDFSSLVSLAIPGVAPDNLFIVGHAGSGATFHSEVIHYNGVDWFVYSELAFPDLQYTDIWTDGQEAFIVGHTRAFPMVSIILHGK